MQTIRDNVWWILGIIFLFVILLRLAGMIGSVWTGLGIAAVVGMAVGISFLPSWKTLASIGLVGWLVITLLTPLFWGSVSFTLQDALGTRRLETETHVAETIGSRGASAARMRYEACSEWEDRFTETIIRPLRTDIATLSPSDPVVQSKTAELKTKEAFLKQKLAECAEGLRYAIPDIEGFLSTRAGATLLFVLLLLSGWGLYRADPKKAAFTRWIGGPLLIATAIYFIYLFFSAGLDKKVEEGITRVWNVSTTLAASKPPPPPPAPKPQPKEEKKIVERWRPPKNGESLYYAAYPFGRRSRVLRQGEVAEVPAMGAGSCSGLWVERGEIIMNSLPLPANPKGEVGAANCNNQPMRFIARWDNTRVKWGACRASNRRCLIQE